MAINLEKSIVNIKKNNYEQPTEVRPFMVQELCDDLLRGKELACTDKYVGYSTFEKAYVIFEGASLLEMLTNAEIRFIVTTPAESKKDACNLYCDEEGDDIDGVVLVPWADKYITFGQCVYYLQERVDSIACLTFEEGTYCEAYGNLSYDDCCKSKNVLDLTPLHGTEVQKAFDELRAAGYHLFFKTNDNVFGNPTYKCSKYPQLGHGWNETDKFEEFIDWE